MKKKPSKAAPRHASARTPKKAAALEQKNRILAAIVESSAAAIISHDPSGRILTWNPGAEKLFGYSAQEAIGQPITILVPAQSRTDDTTIRQRVTRGEGVYQHETVRQHKDGTLLQVLLNISPLHDGSDTILGASTIARDIGEMKKGEAELREAKERLANQTSELTRLVAEQTAELTETNKHLEAFVYSIAHDLRGPLRSMQGFSTLLLQEHGPALDERGRDFARRIAKSARFMDALLRDMLAFSHISQQRVQLVQVKLDLVMHTARARLEEEIREKKAVVDLQGPWPRVLAHESTLTQVVINLMANGIKFVAPEIIPHLTVRTEERGEFTRVWVEDNGIGIAPEHQTQIFQLFTRLGGEAYPGTGLGLAIVQKGIEQMCGKVGVESEAGQGCHFWFELKRGGAV